MTKSTIQKVVDEANAKALNAYETNVKQLVTGIETARKNIADAEKVFAQTVAAQATYIAQQQAAIAKLTPPDNITAESIFGAEVVAAAQ